MQSHQDYFFIWQGVTTYREKNHNRIVYIIRSVKNMINTNSPEQSMEAKKRS